MKWRENIKKKHAKEKKSNKKMRIKFDRKKPEDDEVWKKIIQMITNKVNCNKKKENQIQKTKK
jgi:hypothetical protein